MRARLIGRLCFALLAGCAPAANEGLLRATGAAERAYGAGRYEEAAALYERAAGEAKRPRDRAEMLYREAAAHRRARAWDGARAAYGRLLAEEPRSERATRAAFDLADLEIETSDAAKGYALLRDAALAHPDAGLARPAFSRYLTHLDEVEGAALAWLHQTLPALASTELDETARYALAERLERASDFEGARGVFLVCAERHPYPKGALFDDALYRASLLDERLGEPERAIAHLREMLAVREVSTLSGSYERPRFSAAQQRIAELYRDALHDSRAARRAFHRLYADHPTSILRDDALWEEARLAVADGDGSEACALIATLRREFPSSRYAPCGQALCPAAPASPPGQCHAYVLRSRGGE